MNTRIFNRIIYIVLAAAFLAGCSLPAEVPAATTPSQQEVSTQVAAMLTATALVQPEATQSPTATPVVVISTATLPPTLPATATTAPTATSTTAPTATTGPTATPIKDDPRTVLGGAAFTDKTFKENANWGRAWENDYTRGEFEDNQLVLSSIGVDGWTVSWPKVKDFYIEMTVTTGDCSGSDRYGIIVRVPESFESGYMVGFTCDGRYSLRYWDPENDTYVYLIGWTSSDVIKAGSNQTNRIGLWSEGDTLKVYANGKLLGEAEDSTFDEEGRFGPWIGHGDTEDFTVYISEVSYWDLP
jgi:hypothetical protein